MNKLFIGQRLDQTGLYFYEARYYDAEIGRFISPDSIVPNVANPQSLNRYSYCLNNPLRYTDPSGHQYDFTQEDLEQWVIDHPDDPHLTDEGRQFASDNADRRTELPDPLDDLVNRDGLNSKWALIWKSIPIKDVNLVVRRPNPITVFLGSDWGYEVGNLNLSGEAEYMTVGGDTKVNLYLKLKLTFQMEEKFCLGQTHPPILVYKTSTGEVTYAKTSRIVTYQTPTSDFVYNDNWTVIAPVTPTECDELYVLYEWNVASDDRSIDLGPAYMAPNAMKVDLKDEKVSVQGPNVHL